ncbi:MAG: methyltransferase type 11 [bacterium]|nr:MAG: methyltransferase type 11 [bacterium]
MDKKFDPENFDKLKNPERLKWENPDVIWEKMELKKPEVFVDVGCGIGFSAIPFAKKMPVGIVFACDVNEVMLDMLKNELERTTVKNIKPVLMEEVKIPLAGGTADAALMQNLYHEFNHAADNLDECKRILKSGGTIAVIDWKPVETPFGPPLEIRIEAEKIQGDMEKAGFEVLRNLDIFPYHTFVLARKP